MLPKVESLIGVRDELDQKLVSQFKWELKQIKKAERTSQNLSKITLKITFLAMGFTSRRLSTMMVIIDSWYSTF